MDILLIAELSINGALVGLMYALVALGIVVVYKASRYANLAQGAFCMAGGYACVTIAALLDIPAWAAIPLAVVLMFFVGVLTERFILRRMIGQPVVMVIMLTLGLEILLRGLVPGLLGSTVKRLDIGIPQAPFIVADILINRAYLAGGFIALTFVAAAILFYNTSLVCEISRCLPISNNPTLPGRSKALTCICASPSLSKLQATSSRISPRSI